VVTAAADALRFSTCHCSNASAALVSRPEATRANMRTSINSASSPVLESSQVGMRIMAKRRMGYLFCLV